MTATVLVVLLVLNGHSLAWFIVVLLAMFGRVYFLCHWIFDTIGGLILGIGTVFFFSFVFISFIVDKFIICFFLPLL